MLIIESIKREGWWTWAVEWRLGDQCSGVIVGSPRYILRRLWEWNEPATPRQETT